MLLSRTKYRFFLRLCGWIFMGKKKRVVHHHSHHQANESRNVSISNFVGWTYYYRLFLCTSFSANYDCRLSNSSHERNIGDSKFIKLSGFACQVQKGWQLTLDCDGLVERVLSLGCSPFAWRGRTIHRTCSAPPKSLGWVMGKSAHHAFLATPCLWCVYPLCNWRSPVYTCMHACVRTIAHTRIQAMRACIHSLYGFCCRKNEYTQYIYNMYTYT